MRRKCHVLVALGIVLSSPSIASAKTVSEATLDAESIYYNERTGRTEAQGKAELHYQDIILKAHRLEFDTEANLVMAWGEDGKPLEVQQGASLLTGSYAEYDLNSGLGNLDMPQGQMPAGRGVAYIKGREAETAPVEKAFEDKWFKGKYLKAADDAERAIRWHDVSLTTCRGETHQHYLLKTKRLTVVPGKWVIARRPQVYLEGQYLFTYPFDYVVRGKKQKNSFMPSLNYDSDLGVGLTSGGAFYWNGGQLSLKASWWSKVGLEYAARVDQRLTNWLSIYAETNYLYDKDLEEKKARPHWGALFGAGGWSGKLYWAEREKLSVVKVPGDKAYETTLWRSPDLHVYSPWLGIHTGSFSQYVRLEGMWGRYQESGRFRRGSNWTQRAAWQVSYYTEYPFQVGQWSFVPFFSASYARFYYDDAADSAQHVTQGTLGLIARNGSFEAGLAYVRQRASGRSAMSWDRYSDSDTLYPRLAFHLSPYWRLQVQGLINMRSSSGGGRTSRELKSLGWQLTYDNLCCTRWIFTVIDDLTDRDDNIYGISFEVTAFPESRYALGTQSLPNPFGRPGGLTMRAPRKPSVIEQEGVLLRDQEEIEPYQGLETSVENGSDNVAKPDGHKH